MRRLINGKSHAVYADVEAPFSPIDIHKEMKKSGCITTASTNEMVMDHPAIQSDDGNQLHIPLDMKTWLPFAAPVYHISPNPEDYIIVPVIVMPSDLPNRNGVAFPLRELIKWDPEVGRQAYKTWKGMPTYSEHDNEDYTKSRGVIADSLMRKLNGFNGGQIWKLLLLLTFDRSKYPDVVNRILSGQTNSYSMGAWVNSYECSVCSAELGHCGHISKTSRAFGNYGGQLAFRNAIGIRGFECSEVSTPAFISAISDKVSELKGVE
jgi:hypothetical protein